MADRLTNTVDTCRWQWKTVTVDRGFVVAQGYQRDCDHTILGPSADHQVKCGNCGKPVVRQ